MGKKRARSSSTNNVASVKNNTPRNPASFPTIQNVPTISLVNVPKKKNKNTFSKIVGCRDRSMHIMILFPGEKRCFYGATMVQCIAGEATIDGYEMKNSSYDPQKMNLVCSPHRTGRPVLFEATYMKDNAANYKHNRLRYRLRELTLLYEEIMSVIGDQQPAVFVLSSKIPVAVECIHNLNETLLVPYIAKQHSELEYGWFFPVNSWKVYDDESLRDIDRSIDLITNKRLEGKRCSVVACAEKGSGKSSFLRYYVNRNLKPEYPSVYYLDVDVGQTEFTPPGCLSLWKVTEPMLGIPFAHQKPFFNACLFISSVTPAEDSEKYLNAFEHLLNEFNTKSEPGSLLVINTMGWIKGKGEEMLNHILQQARPDLAVLLPSHSGYFKVPSLVPKVLVVRPVFPVNSFVVDMLKNNQARTQKMLRGKEIRDLSIIAYLASTVPRSVLSSFSEVLPYIIPFKDITFAIPEDLSKFKDEDFFGTINVQIVALCVPLNEDDMKTRKLLGREYLPSIWLTTSDTPPMKCLGFGFIRGVDLAKRNIYVCSPLPSEEMLKVTVLARGAGIPVPIEFLSSQVQMHVPYLTMRSHSNRNNLVHDLYKPLQQRQGYKRAYFPCTE